MKQKKKLSDSENIPYSSNRNETTFLERISNCDKTRRTRKMADNISRYASIS